jgi:hypothetical protein
MPIDEATGQQAGHFGRKQASTWILHENKRRRVAAAIS